MQANFIFYISYLLLIYLLIALIFLLILVIILIRITGFKSIQGNFTLILFIDLFIDFRYYFDMNNDGLKVYTQILFSTFDTFY